MDYQKIELFLAQKGGYFPAVYHQSIRERLAAAPDFKSDIIQFTEYRDPTMMLILSIFLGQLGVDRFLMDDVGMGVLKLVTLGGCGIWWLIDLFSIQEKTRISNYQKLMQIL